MQFIGREEEMLTLQRLKKKASASLVVVKGRRRIGKSRLLEEFAKSFKKAYLFSGIAPREKITAQIQRDEFCKQFQRQFSEMPDSNADWGDLFYSLSEKTIKGEILIVLDEITWMGDHDPDFLGKLKNSWDLYLKRNDQLILVICGSLSTWIEKNILSHTGFLGRESLTLTINEMPLKDCAKFWLHSDTRISSFEKLKLLAVIGGIPRYLESMDPHLTAEHNIQNLCFSPGGILVDEFEKIFSDLFSSKNKLYQSIVSTLADGAKDQKTIAETLNIKNGGDLSLYLEDLTNTGFISRDFTWQIKSNKISRLSQYRLRDNYGRFYLKYILPNKPKIKLGNTKNIALTSLNGWYTIMGLQVENLILNNRDFIKNQLKINPNDIIIDNPFFQRKNKKQLGCQIDYMIQTRFNVLYIIEIKFLAREVGPSIIDEMKKKIQRLNFPKGFSYRPVLIHCNGVSSAVEESQYFSDIINLSDILC